MAMRADHRNILVLAACQALVQTGLVSIITASGLAGHMLATEKSLATLPVSFLMIGTMITTIPASLFMGRFGRRAGFWLGTLLGALGGVLGVISLINGWFWLFCFAHIFYGGYQGFAQFYRFAAAEAVASAFRSRAISYVLLGAAVAAVVGPHLVAYTKDFAASGAFVATYAIIVVLSLIATIVVSFIDLPKPVEQKTAEKSRRISAVVAQPTFLVAVTVAAIGFGVMNLAMTATPLAMAHHHHGLNETAFVIQWHVLGMFLPSFFTGNLIGRFGAPRIMLAGVALLSSHVAIALSGVEFLHFASALVLLGVGWNFMYLGGTTLVTETYRPSEKAWAQGIFDFTVLTTVVISSFASGALLHAFGWTGVNLLAVPLLIAAGAALAAYMVWSRRPVARAPAE
jgi:MFS family permease